jgi:hypothetical protein
LGDFGVVSEPEVLESFDLREPCVDQASFLAPLGALSHLRFKQRAQICDGGLLLSECFGGERFEAAADGREFQLDRVRLDQRFQGGGLCVAGGSGGHRDPPSSWS